MINNCIKNIQNKLFLPSCLICRAPGLDNLSICQACTDKLRDNQKCCQRCSLPLATTAQVLCPACQTSPPGFHSSFIPYQYRGEIINLVRNFKFSGNMTSGKVLAELFCRKLTTGNIVKPDLLVPVPLHPARTRHRGFNQALWLANQIGRQLNIEVNHKLVTRRVNSASQHLLNKQARLNNLKQAFRLENKHLPSHIAIIDDVVTTGSTANAIASLFKHNNDIVIQLWAIARTPLE